MRLFSSARQCRAGVTLIECLVYVAVFLTFLCTAFALFYRGSDNYVGLRRNAEEITSALHAGERWRDDIRQAEGTAGYVESEGDAVWRIPTADGDIFYVHEDEGVWRLESPDGNREKILDRVATSAMKPTDRHGVKCYAWTVQLKTQRKAPTVQPLFHFLAVPVAEEQR